MQAATASAAPHRPRKRLGTRPVIYKSSALERTAPQLVSAASADKVSAARSIQNANATAEKVRSSYKLTKDIDLGKAVDGDDDASNAKKYERRLKMNRQSAAASRVRREAYTKALEAELVTMEQEYQATVLKLQAALERNRQLQKAQAVELIDDGTAHTLKQEDEEEPDVDLVEQVEIQQEQQGPVVDQVADFDMQLDAAFPEVMQQLGIPSAPPKQEGLLAEACFLENPDVLQLPVPDTLPECFLIPPTEHADFGVDQNDFL